MRKETGNSLKAMERNLQIKGGLLKTFPFEIAKFMLNPLQGGHDPGAIYRRWSRRTHGQMTPIFTNTSANNRKTFSRFDTFRQVSPLDSMSEDIMIMRTIE
jgi:hypothetical protein